MNQELILQLAFLQGQHALLGAQAALVIFRRRRNRRISSCWVRPWLSAERRLQFGHYDRLLVELRMEDQQSFFNFLRMPPEMFDELLNRVGPRIRKMDTHYRKALEPGMKLAIDTWHLVTSIRPCSMSSELPATQSSPPCFLASTTPFILWHLRKVFQHK